MLLRPQTKGAQAQVQTFASPFPMRLRFKCIDVCLCLVPLLLQPLGLGMLTRNLRHMP